VIATDGLSLDQAPPLDLPLRLFLTAPLFAAAAGLLMLIDAPSILATRWTPAAIAATHLITIGFLGSVMVGALLQMLPVLGGLTIPAVRWVGGSVHVLLASGAILLAGGFLGLGSSALAGGAAASALGFGIFVSAMLAALWRGRRSAAKLGQFSLVALALLITIGLGLLLTMAVLGWHPLPGLLDWAQVHANWGLFGWVGLLILTVGFQVVPLFHVTPAYPRLVIRALVPLLFLTLCAASLVPLLPPEIMAPLRWLLAGLIALGFSLFAGLTLRLQAQRARTQRDATLLHWWLAMAALLAAVPAWLLQAPAELIGVLLLVGVGVGLPSGMLLKILPFLCWFHLQSRQISLGRLHARIPHMHRLLPERPARWHVALHAAALLLLIAGLWAPLLARTGGILLAASALWLLVLLGSIAWRYRNAARALEQAR
jgi:hypothetical protein